jgi:hypothetical protein
MKAYLVDPERHHIEEIDLPDDAKERLAEMRRLIGAEGGLDHTTISDEHDQIWLDDLGLTRGRCWGWKLQGMREPLAGKGIVIGVDDAGRTRPPFVPLQWIIRDAVWLDEIIPELTHVKTEYGHRIVVTYTRAN